MHRFDVPHEVAPLIEFLGANVTFESLDVTNSMNRRHVSLQRAFFHKLLAANHTIEISVWVLAFTAAALSMRSVVVSVDR